MLGCDTCGRIMTDTPLEPDPKDSPPAKKPPRLTLDQNGRILHVEREEDEPTDSKGGDSPAMFSRAETAKIREMLGAQGVAPICPHCRSELSVGHPAAGGGSIGPVWPVWCQRCNREALVTEVPGGRRPLSNAELARHLPEQFVRMDALPRYRIIKLVARNWLHCPEVQRNELVRLLTPVLEPLLEKDAEVTDAVRKQCEEIVVSWLLSQ